MRMIIERMPVPITIVILENIGKDYTKILALGNFVHFYTFGSEEIVPMGFKSIVCQIL